MFRKIHTVYRTVKAHKWWQSKVPFYLAIAYLVVLKAGTYPPVWELLGLIVLFLLATFGLAGFGHFINDWFDIEADRLAGKENVVAGMGPGKRVAVLAGLVLWSVLPWFVLPFDWRIGAALVAQASLLVMYAMPPVRLKERKWLGVATDAIYAYTNPFIITILTFELIAGRAGLIFNDPIVWLLLIWSFLIGFRSILHHQILDAVNDRISGTATLVTTVGEGRSFWWVSRIVIPLELLLFGIVLWYFDPCFLIVYIIYLLWRAFQLRYIWSERYNPFYEPVPADFLRIYAFMYLNFFYEKWLATIVILALIVEDPLYVGLLVFQLVLFENGIWDFLYKDARWIPDGIKNMMRKTG